MPPEPYPPAPLRGPTPGPPASEVQSLDSEASSDDEGERGLVVGEYVRNPINLNDRPPMKVGQKMMCGLFYGQLLLQFAASVTILCSRNYLPSHLVGAGGCPPGWAKLDDGSCMSKSFSSEHDACMGAPSGATARPLLDKVKELHRARTMWQMLGDHAAVPRALIPLAVALCVIWLLTLTRAAGCVVWMTFAVNLVVLGYGAILTQNWMLAGAAVGLAALASVAADKINLAIGSMQVAAGALTETPSIFVVSGLFQMCWVGYGGVLFYTLTQTGRVMLLDEQCNVTILGMPSRIFINVCSFLFLLTTFFTRNCILSVCALGIGCWYFPEAAPDDDVIPAAAGAELAVTTSSGSVALASLIMDAVEFAWSQTENPCWWLDPLACFVRMLGCCAESPVAGLTRFSLIAHVLHGDPLCYVSKVTIGLLRRHLPGLLVTSVVADEVLDQLSTLLATSFGLASWFIVDASEGGSFFYMLTEGVARSQTWGDVQRGSWLLFGLVLLLLFFARRPLLTLVAVCVIQGNFGIRDDRLNVFSIGIFMASIVAVIFQAFAKIVEYSTDTISYCYALEAEGGKRQVRMAPLYGLMAQQASRRRLEAD